MESLIERLNMEGKKKEILGNAVELLERAGVITVEEKECVLHMIWKEEVWKDFLSGQGTPAGISEFHNRLFVPPKAAWRKGMG